MPARAIASGTISFGLVSIPVKLFTAASSEQVRFNMLHSSCKSRIKQKLYCPTDDAVVERGDTVKGYEYARGQYVVFDEEEVKALETERSQSLDIVEFVPLATVDFVHVEKTYYLGADKGGDKAYQLLGESMERTGRVAVGRWAARGKEQLVLIRPYQKGLMLHQLYYASEVRAFEEVDTGATFEFKDIERDLAEKLIAELTTDRFAPEKYSDDYADRVRAAVDKKVAGQEIAIAPEAPKAQIIDLFEALKKSLSDAREAVREPAAKDDLAKAEPTRPKAEARPVKKAGPRKGTSKKKSKSA